MTELWFLDYLVNSWLPEGKSGDWQVKRLAVEGDLQQWLREFDVRSGFTPPGLYSVLYCGDECWMTDQPRELLDSQRFCEDARGRILITGLGIGAVPAWLALRHRVERIDIVEREADVIRLVWPHLRQRSSKLHLHHADALQWQPNGQWDWAWHDIWPTYPTAEQQQALANRYAPFVTEQRCWQSFEQELVSSNEN
jgi:hypothetical protein